MKLKFTQYKSLINIVTNNISQQLGLLGEIAIAVKQETACKTAKFFEMGNGIEFLNEKFT